MPNRPSLTDESFYRFLFSPKKNPQPVGIRARSLKVSKGRKGGRVASYNRMSAVNQEILRRSGQRESYLRGELSLAQAKRAVRETAVELGFAKPLRGQPVRTRQTARKRTLDAFVATRIIRGLRESGRSPNPVTVARGVPFIGDDDYYRIDEMSGRDFISMAHDDDREIEVGGQKFNPFWYH